MIQQQIYCLFSLLDLSDERWCCLAGFSHTLIRLSCRSVGKPFPMRSVSIRDCEISICCCALANCQLFWLKMCVSTFDARQLSFVVSRLGHAKVMRNGKEMFVDRRLCRVFANESFDKCDKNNKNTLFIHKTCDKHRE